MVLVILEHMNFNYTGDLPIFKRTITIVLELSKFFFFNEINQIISLISLNFISLSNFSLNQLDQVEMNCYSTSLLWQLHSEIAISIESTHLSMFSHSINRWNTRRNRTVNPLVGRYKVPSWGELCSESISLVGRFKYDVRIITIIAIIRAQFDQNFRVRSKLFVRKTKLVLFCLFGQHFRVWSGTFFWQQKSPYVAITCCSLTRKKLFFLSKFWFFKSTFFSFKVKKLPKG